MPESTPVILFLWGIVVLVVFYFQRHKKQKSRVVFFTLIGLSTALLFLLLFFLQSKNQPLFNPTRIGIFPFINQKDQPLTWESLALSEIPTNYLDHANSKKVLIYEQDWIMFAMNQDSMTFSSYLQDFSKRIQLDYGVYGAFTRDAKEYFVRYKVIENQNGEIVFEDSTTLSSNRLDLFEEKIAGALSKIVPLIQLNKLVNNEDYKYYLRKHFKSRLALTYGNPLAARDLLEESLKEDSSSVACLNLLSRLYLKEGSQKKARSQDFFSDFKIAKSLLLKALSLEPENSKAMRLLGELYLANEKWSKAENYLRQSYALNPWDSKIYLAFSQLYPERYQDLGFDNEIELLERAVFINPCDFAARLTLVQIYQKNNRFDLAHEHANQVLQINPESIDGLMAAGELYLLKNNLLNMLETYEKIIRLDPENSDAFYNLGIVYYYQKDYDSALKFFQRAVALDGHADSHLYLAKIYELKQEMDKAILHLRMRIRKRKGDDDPFYKEARDHLFEIMTQLGRVDSLKTEI